MTKQEPTIEIPDFGTAPINYRIQPAWLNSRDEYQLAVSVGNGRWELVGIAAPEPRQLTDTERATIARLIQPFIPDASNVEVKQPGSAPIKVGQE